jgi:hypothetical protein
VRAKVEQRAPEVQIETEKREAPKVVNIMDALKTAALGARPRGLTPRPALAHKRDQVLVERPFI